LQSSTVAARPGGSRWGNAVRKHIPRYLQRFKYLLADPRKDIRLEPASPRQPDADEREIARRILDSYKAMQRDLADHPRRELYYPSDLWERNLQTGYAPMAEAARNDDAAGLAYFLANALSWHDHLGILHGGVHQDFRRLGPLKRRYLKAEVFGRHLDLWRYLHGYRGSVEALRHPRAGNPDGAVIDGVFVTAHGFFHEYYSFLLEQLLRHVERPVIAELGGGYGTQQFFLRNKVPEAVSIDFDLPEVVCVAAFFLLCAFPDKEFLLYGEQELTAAIIDQFDFILMPAPEIEKLTERCVDLFINMNSLGEMRAATASAYVEHISRSAKMFFHRNKEFRPRRFPDGEYGLVNPELPIPGSAVMLWRYPCIIQNVHKNAGRLNLGHDTFAYLYRLA